VFAIVNNLNAQKRLANNDFILRSMDMIVTDPQLLSLHGISAEELKSDGVSVEEFVYVYKSMLAGSVMQNTAEKKHFNLTPRKSCPRSCL
jgi:hypothetical protein